MAFGNFYPKLRFNPVNCNILTRNHQSVMEKVADAMKAVVSNGYTPYHCRFQPAWFTQWKNAYTIEDEGNRLQTIRTDQTRCETQFVKPWMENNVNGFVWRVKDDCVYPTKREEQTPIPALIQPSWP